MTAHAPWLDEAWNKVYEKVTRTSQTIGSRFPHATRDGKYVLERPHWWTAGFWPGLLWLLYRESRHEPFRQIAEECERQLDQVIDDFCTLDHDIGFMWTLTSLARYKLLGEPDARRRALHAANLLAARFNLQGRFIRAWNPWHENEDNSGWAIIDCMMNLPLLYWASEETKDPRFHQIARAHAETVLSTFIRGDGSVYHIYTFDPFTGEPAGPLGGQGYAPESAWARGTSWALYGFALTYRYAKEPKFLDAAKRVAHFFLSHLPEDFVPHWDFRLPSEAPRHRDSSAGACAACGLILLAELVPPHEAPVYRQAAEKILHSLYVNYGTWDDPGQEGLILAGTGHFPAGQNIGVSLIYGDYYFVEGLSRLRGNTELFW